MRIRTTALDLLIAVLLPAWLPGCGETPPSDRAASATAANAASEETGAPSSESDGASPAEPAAGADTDPLDTQPRTRDAAVAALDAYLAASAAGDGDRAIGFLHPSYFEMTARQIDAALDADARTVEAMGTMDRLMVYALRFRLEPLELRTLTPRQLAVLAIERGWIDDEVTARATVSGVRLLPEGSASPDRALVSLEYQGTPVDAPIPVSYHQGRWLVDLAAMMADAGASIERMAAQFGLALDEFIRRALAATEGRPVPDTIHEPVGR